jgi:hypothetical protein
MKPKFVLLQPPTATLIYTNFKYELLFGDQRNTINETLFNADPSTGQMGVSECPTPGDHEACSSLLPDPVGD